MEKGGITLDEVSQIIDIMAETVDIVQCSAGKTHNSFYRDFHLPIPVHAAGLQQLLGKGDEKERAQMPDRNSGRH